MEMAARRELGFCRMEKNVQEMVGPLEVGFKDGDDDDNEMLKIDRK